VLDGAQPKNEIGAMLILQMAVTHALAMKKAATLNQVKTIPQQDSAGLALMRLNRTFTTQVEALASLRRGGRQRMTVEHVHVHSVGQAIVGNVAHAKKEGLRMKRANNPKERKTGEPLSLRNAQRCGARNRSGKPCQSPVVGSARVRSAQRAAQRKL
jgi:hypothetical protein